jgi:hypothetical protein
MGAKLLQSMSFYLLTLRTYASTTLSAKFVLSVVEGHVA